MSLRDNTERHLFYKDIYKHRGYAYFSGGRSVVETRKYKVIDHHLKHCAIAHYASAVVEWSNIFENHK